MESKITKKQPILVTGGAGYIGSYVTQLLLEAGYKVRVFDKFVFGQEIISDLSKNPNLEIVVGDMSDILKPAEAFQGVQAVIHLAGLVGDPACAIDPEFTTHVNVVSTRIIKELSKSFKIKRFIFASSCSVYGVSDEIITEDGKLNPVSLYAKTKIDTEKELLHDRNHIFHPTILRFATVYGHSRRPRFDLVTNFFTAQAYNDGVITVKGSDQWRPLVHVKDIARAVVKTISAPLDIVDGEIFNVGDNGLNTTIGELANKVKSVVSKSKNGASTVITIDDSSSDKRNYRVSFDKIYKKLKFKASISLTEGIEEIYKHFKNGDYLGSYKDPMYSNVEMTRLLQTEFHTLEYRKNHISTLDAMM